MMPPVHQSGKSPQLGLVSFLQVHIFDGGHETEHPVFLSPRQLQVQVENFPERRKYLWHVYGVPDTFPSAGDMVRDNRSKDPASWSFCFSWGHG